MSCWLIGDKMKRIVHLNTYILPKNRKDEIFKIDAVVDLFVNTEPFSHYTINFLQIRSEDSATCVLLGQQLAKAAKNATNSVKGTMKVVNILDTFDKIPNTTDEHRSLSLRKGEQIIISSTDFAAYLEIVLPALKSPGITVFTLKVEEVLAAVENVTR